MKTFTVTREGNGTYELVLRPEWTDGEPRVRDLDLAKWLGFTDPHMIRRLIRRHAGRITPWVSVTVTETSPKGGRPGTEFWLTEREALFIASQSKTDKALDVTQKVIDVFVRVRRQMMEPPAAPPPLPSVEPSPEEYEPYHRPISPLRKIGPLSTSITLTLTPQELANLTEFADFIFPLGTLTQGDVTLALRVLARKFHQHVLAMLDPAAEGVTIGGKPRPANAPGAMAAAAAQAPRDEAELAKAELLKAKRSAAGKAGNAKRWGAAKALSDARAPSMA